MWSIRSRSALDEVFHTTVAPSGAHLTLTAFLQHDMNSLPDLLLLVRQRPLLSFYGEMQSRSGAGTTQRMAVQLSEAVFNGLDARRSLLRPPHANMMLHSSSTVGFRVRPNP
jgi:hypothetical protein